MVEEDVAYFEQRARQERERAASCGDPVIAKTHLRMAEEYEKRLRGECLRSYLGDHGPDRAIDSQVVA